MRIKNWLRGLVFGGLFTLGSLIANKAEAVDMDGFFINEPDCTTTIWRKPKGSIDTLQTITDADGLWVGLTEQFEPDAVLGETLYVEGQKNGKTAKTMWVRGPPGENTIFDMYLDKHTINIEDVIDTSGLANPLRAIYSLDGIAPCTTEVDTGWDQGWAYYYDVHVPFDKADATQGKAGNIDLVKTVADTTYRTSIPFTVDKTAFDAQASTSPIYFPLEKIVTDTTPPVISDATEWPDTIHQGPYEVSYTRTDDSGIATDSLTYKINHGDEKTVPADSIVGDKAYCTIEDTTAPDDSVFYRVKAVDNSANANTSYWPGQDDWHSFKVKSVGAEEPSVSGKDFKAWYSRNCLHVEGAEKVSVRDIAGREVRGSYDNKSTNTTGTYDFVVPSGVYFVTADEGPAEGRTKKVVKMR